MAALQPGSDPTEAVPTDPELVDEATFRLGEILHGRGETAAARSFLEQAVESDFAPFDQQARDLLRDLGQDATAAIRWQRAAGQPGLRTDQICSAGQRRAQSRPSSSQ